MNYTYSGHFSPNTLARAEDLEDEFRAIASSISGQFFRASDGLPGVDSAWAVKNPTLPQDAVNLGALTERLVSITRERTGLLSGYAENVVRLTGTANVADASDCNVFTLDMTVTGAASVSITCPVDGFSHSITLYVNGATGSAPPSILGSIAWAGAVEPQWSGRDIVVLHTVDNGGTWFGSVINFNPLAAPTDGGGGGSGGGGGGPVLPVTYEQHALSDDPLIFWRLDDYDEYIAFDRSGEGNHGYFFEIKSANINNTPVYSFLAKLPSRPWYPQYKGSTGAFNPRFQTHVGMALPGVNGATQVLSVTGEQITIESWIWLSNDTPLAGAVAWTLKGTNGQRIRLFVRSPVGPRVVLETLDQTIITPIAPAFNKMTPIHVAVVVDGTAGNLIFYVNGELISSASGLAAQHVASFYSVALTAQMPDRPDGTYDQIFESVFRLSAHISMSGFAIYPTALPADRILAHYNAGK